MQIVRSHPTGSRPALLGPWVNDIVALLEKGHIVGHNSAGPSAQELEREWKTNVQILEVVSEFSGMALVPLLVMSVVG